MVLSSKLISTESRDKVIFCLFKSGYQSAVHFLEVP